MRRSFSFLSSDEKSEFISSLKQFVADLAFVELSDIGFSTEDMRTLEQLLMHFISVASVNNEILSKGEKIFNIKSKNDAIENKPDEALNTLSVSEARVTAEIHRERSRINIHDIDYNLAALACFGEDGLNKAAFIFGISLFLNHQEHIQQQEKLIQDAVASIVCERNRRGDDRFILNLMLVKEIFNEIFGVLYRKLIQITVEKNVTFYLLSPTNISLRCDLFQTLRKILHTFGSKRGMEAKEYRYFHSFRCNIIDCVLEHGSHSVPTADPRMMSYVRKVMLNECKILLDAIDDCETVSGLEDKITQFLALNKRGETGEKIILNLQIRLFELMPSDVKTRLHPLMVSNNAYIATVTSLTPC